MKLIIFTLILSTLVVVNSRIITFINQCPFNIGVEGSGVGVVCNLQSGASCGWTIPAAGYQGRFYRHNTAGDSTGYPSATLAEFNLGNQNDNSQWNMDWFDISIIPPGCPGSITSYTGCVQYTGQDGYDVGMTMSPLACPDKTRTCLGTGCSGAYGYPTDDSKTTTCQNVNGNWQVTFCPPGSSNSGITGTNNNNNNNINNNNNNNNNPAGNSNNGNSGSGSGVCQGSCVVGGFAGSCTGSSCPVCWVPAANGGYSCFAKSGGSCPGWSGMVDCTGQLSAVEDENPQLNQNSKWESNPALPFSVGLVIGIFCTGVIAIIIIAVGSKKEEEVVESA